eukprot:UN15269
MISSSSNRVASFSYVIILLALRGRSHGSLKHSFSVTGCHIAFVTSSLFFLSFSCSASVSRAPRNWRYKARSLFTIFMAQSGGVGSS